MYIDRVVLKNIRGFEHLDFDLSRGDGKYAGWTVFTGDNGAGKSTFLKAVAVALIGKDAARLAPVLGRRHAKAVLGQEPRQQVANLAIVIHDQQMGRAVHGRSSSRIRWIHSGRRRQRRKKSGYRL